MRKNRLLPVVIVILIGLQPTAFADGQRFRGGQGEVQGTYGPIYKPLVDQFGDPERNLGAFGTSAITRYHLENIAASGQKAQHTVMIQAGAWARIKEYGWLSVQTGCAAGGEAEIYMAFPVSLWTRLRLYEGRVSVISESTLLLPYIGGEMAYQGLYRADYYGSLPTSGVRSEAAAIQLFSPEISEEDLVRRVRPLWVNLGLHTEQRGLGMTFGPHFGVGPPGGGVRGEVQYHLGLSDGIWNHAVRVMLLLGTF